MHYILNHSLKIFSEMYQHIRCMSIYEFIA